MGHSEISTSATCLDCKGRRLSSEAGAIMDSLLPYSGAARGELSEQDVAALQQDGYFAERFFDSARREWVQLAVATVDEVNRINGASGIHPWKLDSRAAAIVARSRCEQSGIPVWCGFCDGAGLEAVAPAA